LFTKQINNDIRHPVRNQAVSEFVIGLFNQGLSNELIEEKVANYFRLKEKKKDKKI
jgi:hypothetical protein